MKFAVTGIDPGVVHTGVVRIEFDPRHKTWEVTSALLNGLDVDGAVVFSQMHPSDRVFIEKYSPRSHYKQDPAMVEATNRMHRMIDNSVLLDNTGSRQIISDDTMKLVNCWKFTPVSHHQDQRSAARIALYGLVKEADWNTVLFQFVYDQHSGNAWKQVGKP